MTNAELIARARELADTIYPMEPAELRTLLPALAGSVEELTTAIEDIDAHATPLGEDEDGFITTGYLVSVGSLHRALGKLGHSAVKCTAETERDAALRDRDHWLATYSDTWEELSDALALNARLEKENAELKALANDLSRGPR